MLSKEMVRDVIAESVDGFDVSAIDDETNFIDAGLDSLDHANILFALQERHGITVDDEYVEECQSINGILAFAANIRA